MKKNNIQQASKCMTSKQIAAIIAKYPDTTRVSAMYNITGKTYGIVYDIIDDVLYLTDDVEFVRDELFWDYDEDQNVHKEDFVIYKG